MQKFAPLQKKIGIKFKDKKLLETAFVHKSYINEHKDEDLEDNERLEFLGDAVLELVATEYLFRNHPEQTEGEMTNFRSALVKGKHLAQIAKDLELGQYLSLSHGEENSGGREKNYILANTVESLIGAIYLDQGFTPSKVFITNFILIKLDDIIEQNLHIDPKSRFQEIVQEKEDVTPEYKVLEAKGPDHDKKFVSGVYIDEKLIEKGKGSSKQKSEEDAAKNALIKKGWHK
jgi:ribonuclease III